MDHIGSKLSFEMKLIIFHQPIHFVYIWVNSTLIYIFLDKYKLKKIPFRMYPQHKISIKTISTSQCYGIKFFGEIELFEMHQIIV